MDARDHSAQMLIGASTGISEGKDNFRNLDEANRSFQTHSRADHCLEPAYFPGSF